MLKAADFRKIARESLKGNWLVAVGTGVIATLLGGSIMETSGSVTALTKNFDASLEETVRSIASDPTIMNILMAFAAVTSVISIAYALAMMIIRGAVSMGYARFNLNLVNRSNPKVEDIFSQFKYFGKAFIMMFLRGLYVTLGFILFIIPGVIASYAYIMAPYILMENPEMTANEALKASKELMKGNKWRLFCLGFSFIGWGLLAGLTFGVGNLFLRPYTEAACAAFYREIKWEKMKQQAGME